MQSGVEALILAPLRRRNYPFMLIKDGAYWLDDATSDRTGTLFRRGTDLGSIDAAIVRSSSYFMFLDGARTYLYNTRWGVRYSVDNKDYWLRRHCSGRFVGGMEETGPEDNGGDEEAGPWEGVVLVGDTATLQETIKEEGMMAQDMVKIDDGALFPYGPLDSDTSSGTPLSLFLPLLLLTLALLL